MWTIFGMWALRDVHLPNIMISNRENLLLTGPWPAKLTHLHQAQSHLGYGPVKSQNSHTDDDHPFLSERRSLI